MASDNNGTSDQLVAILSEIRNWVRAASYKQVRELLSESLPDSKSRLAYQAFDGTASVEQVRIACKMSPNAVVALTARCVSLGLMSTNPDKKRMRLFDLNDFGLAAETSVDSEGKKR